VFGERVDDDDDDYVTLQLHNTGVEGNVYNSSLKLGGNML